MLVIRKANDRGITSTGWLRSYHTFSFGQYYDPNFLGFGNLLVINEDTVKPGFGFPPHTHNDMEIITFVIDGAIQHKDSMGESHVLKAGEIQRMTAGTGIRHSEYNASSQEDLHFLQIWILPKQKDLTPSYEQKSFPKTHNDLTLIVAPEGGRNAVSIHQDVSLFYASLERGNTMAYTFDEKDYGWVQVMRGSLIINENLLNQGDGIAIIDEPKITFESMDETEILLFDFKNRQNIKIVE